MIAFLGTGLLGANFTRSMIKRGTQVRVWNRTKSKADQLEQYGAKSSENPADAVRGAERVHVALRDDDAVNEVLARASGGFAPGTVIVDHTTTSVEGAKSRTAAWKAKGFFYQHAPVFMGPVNALESTGFMLISGEPDLVARLTPELSKMTGKLLNFGSEPGKAAAMKLLGNTFLVCYTAGIADTLTLARALEVPSADISQLFEAWNPSTTLPARLKRVDNQNYDEPSWELSMARKDVGLFMQSAEKKGAHFTVIPHVAKKMDELLAAGNGHKDWTIIGKASR